MSGRSGTERSGGPAPGGGLLRSGAAWAAALLVLPCAAAAPRPASAQEDARTEARHALVEQRIATPGPGRDAVRDTAVLRAMRSVPRHEFVPPEHAGRAYADIPLPIGHGQTISQPYVVAAMTELLEPGPEDRVLEVGTGSGYQAAVLAEIVAEVYTIEIVEPLSTSAARRLERLGYGDIHVRHGDGYYGWPAAAPFDAIVVTAAASHIPPPLLDQLEPGGRMVIPVGPPLQVQTLMLVEKRPDGSVTQRSLMPVRFVPFTRSE